MTKQEAVALLDSFWWQATGKKIKQSELDEYVPLLLKGNNDGVFKKVFKFDIVKEHVGKLKKEDVVEYVKANLK